MPRILFCLYGTLLTGLVITLLVYLSLARTDGTLIYTLDDPYVHLALAESILAGGYGVNLGEVASPSSSILFPLLLSLTLGAGLGDWGGLAMAGVSSLLTAWLVASVIWRYAVEPRRWGSILAAMACLPLVYGVFHLYAMPMMGMEHALHVLATTAVVVGLAELRRDYAPSLILLVGIFFAPLLRFEGLALAVPALAILLVMGHVRAFVFTAGALALAFAAFWGVMLSLGLPLFPSSVLVKSNVMEAAANESLVALIQSLAENVHLTLRLRFGMIYAGTIALLLLTISWEPPESRWRLLPLTLALTSALIGHSLLGSYGSMHRLEAYTLGICVAALIVAFGHVLRRPGGSMLFRAMGVVAFLIVLALPPLSRVATTPAAAENIYAQQHQMHRFATEFFPHPVAVNDLGWVTYQNDLHVLDLWGLGSERARVARTADKTGAAGIDALTSEAGTVYAMIYDEWFESGLPDGWCRIAVLQTPKVSAAEGQVAFYLIDRAREAEMRGALKRFSQTLPAVSRIEAKPCD